VSAAGARRRNPERSEGSIRRCAPPLASFFWCASLCFAQQLWGASWVGPKQICFWLQDGALRTGLVGPSRRFSKFCRVPSRLRRSEIASQRESESGTNFAHSQGTQMGNSPAQPALRNCNHIVEVYCARGLHAVLFVQDHFRRHATDRGCDRCNGDRREISDSAVASQHNHRPPLVRGRKLVKSDVSPGYPAGHAASVSQTRDSSAVGGRLE